MDGAPSLTLSAGEALESREGTSTMSVVSWEGTTARRPAVSAYEDGQPEVANWRPAWRLFLDTQIMQISKTT
jgi:hypothetical protein